MSETRATYTTDTPALAAIDWEHPYSDLAWRRINDHRYRERRRAWYDPASATLILPHGTAMRFSGSYGALLDVLATFSDVPEMVMLCGGSSAADTPTREELEQPTEHGWSVAMRYDDERAEYNRAHVTYRRADVQIELRTTADWFGACTDAEALRDAWMHLAMQLRAAFRDTSITLISTPGRTGIDLLERNLPRHKAGERAGWSHEYPVLSDPLRQLLYATNGQGRLEFVERPRGGQVDGLWCLDARWMYAACLANLPTGPILHDERDEAMPYVPGFYRVSGRVPRGWDRVGLFGMLRYRGDESERTYPHRPGAAYEGWVSSAELALTQNNNWAPRIHERILWPVTSSDPAGHWIRTLRKLRAEMQDRAALTGERRWELLAHALRAIVLQAVGFWHRRSGWAICTVPHAGEVRLPANAELLADRSGRVTYRVPMPLHDERYCHPEWSATVWGRARARLVTRALDFPRGQIAALRTDGIWLTVDPGDPPDDGRPGAWRRKGHVPGPLAYPASAEAFVALIREARAE